MPDNLTFAPQFKITPEMARSLMQIEAVKEAFEENCAPDYNSLLDHDRGKPAQ
jgi:hypothetical protein